MDASLFPDLCGLLKIPPDKIVPYVVVDGHKYVPIRLFSDYEKLNVETRVIDVQEDSNLKFCCDDSKKNDNMSSVSQCTLATIDDIQKCLNIEYEEYLPDDILKLQAMKYKEDIKSSLQIKDENSSSSDEFSLKIHLSDSSQSSNSSCESKLQIDEDVIYVDTENYHDTPLKETKPKGSKTRKQIDLEIEEYKMLRKEQLRIKRTQALANETPEQRNNRLQKLRIKQAERIANETPEKRKIRLEKLKFYQQRRLANETPEQREKRLSKLRVSQAMRLMRKKQAALEEKLKKSNDSQQPINNNGTNTSLDNQDASNSAESISGGQLYYQPTDSSNYSIQTFNIPVNSSDNLRNHQNQFCKDIMYAPMFTVSNATGNITSHHPMELTNNPIGMAQRKHPPEH